MKHSLWPKVSIFYPDVSKAKYDEPVLPNRDEKLLEEGGFDLKWKNLFHGQQRGLKLAVLISLLYYFASRPQLRGR